MTQRYRPPLWLNVTVGAASAALLVWFSAWLLRDRPTEFLRGNAPELAALPELQLAEQMASDERSLVAVIDGLGELEKTFRAFEADLQAGRRSYYKQTDDDEIRRLLVTFLSYRAVLLRTVWKYQRHEDVEPDGARLRALLLHYTAAAVAFITSPLKRRTGTPPSPSTKTSSASPKKSPGPTPTATAPACSTPAAAATWRFLKTTSKLPRPAACCSTSPSAQRT